MDGDQPSLFGPPDHAPQAPQQSLQLGRNRLVWVRTATAKVTITDASAVRQAAARSNEGFVITIASADLGVEDSEPDAPNAEPSNDPSTHWPG